MTRIRMYVYEIEMKGRGTRKNLRRKRIRKEKRRTMNKQKKKKYNHKVNNNKQKNNDPFSTKKSIYSLGALVVATPASIPTG